MKATEDAPSDLALVRTRAARLKRAEKDVAEARNELYAAIRRAREQDPPSYAALAVASGLTKARIQQILTGTRRGNR